MPNPEPRFSADEYARRLAKTRAAMEAKGVDCLIVSDPSNMHWLTGYDGWSFYVHQAVVVPPTGNPVWYGRGQDAAGAQRTAWLPDADIVGYPDHYVQSTERHPMDFLAGVLAERGSTGSRSASRWTTTGSPPPPSRSLQRDLPNARFVRRDRPRQLAARGEERRRDRLHAQGRAHRRGDARADRRDGRGPACASATSSPRSSPPAPAARPTFGGDYPAIVPLLPSGADAAAPHLTWDDKPMKAGEGTFFEIAGCYHRYHCPLSRTVFLGKPTQEFLDAESATLEGMEAGLAAAKPGNTCEDIAKAFFAVLNEVRHRQGQPHRLFDRPQLSARLGRAHDEPAFRRPHRARARHDLPLHDRPLARDHGASRSPRVDPHHRDRRRVPRRRSRAS